MLLDTHVALWLLDDSPRLGRRTRDLLATAPAVFVSAVSMWEIAIKSELGKLRVPDDLVGRIDEAGLAWLAFTPHDAWATRAVDGLPHRDPFDRALVAQASAASVPLVTADLALLGAPLVPRVPRHDAHE